MPIQWDDLEVNDATVEQFESIPDRSGKRQDPRIVALLDDLEAGKVKEIRLPDEAQMRSLRVALGRAASQRGFRLWYRSDGPLVYIRKSDKPLKPKSSSQQSVGGNGRRTRGRPRKETPVVSELLETD
jgi:hypothetical protein